MHAVEYYEPLKNEWSSDPRCNMDEPLKLSKRNEPDTKGRMLYDSTYMSVRFLEQTSRRDQKYNRGYHALGGKGDREYLFTAYKVSVWDDTIF